MTASESSGTANENGTVNFKEWMIAIISMTKRDTVNFKEWMIAIISMTKRDTLLLQGMDGCN